MVRHIDGRRAVIPSHSGDIPRGTLRAILDDLEISTDELLAMR